MKHRFLTLFLALLLLCTSLCGCMDGLDGLFPSSTTTKIITTSPQDLQKTPVGNITLDQVPAFSDKPYIPINANVPFFTEEEITDESFESYAPLDSLGRCGVAIACVGIDLMPTEDRKSISSVKPSGWQSVQYDIVSGKDLYNRCHLIGFQLTGENANKYNLITGTRYLNVDAMLPFENMVADYVKETENHVMYRVTPIFHGNELVARGVLIEGYSVEDEGADICFNIYCYNNQPGIVIDYATGLSRLATEDEWSQTTVVTTTTDPAKVEYVLNKKSKKFHLPSCSGAKTISDANRGSQVGDRQDLINQGYSPCGTCDP